MPRHNCVPVLFIRPEAGGPVTLRAGKATESLSDAKKRRMSELAIAYAADHPELPANLRIDLIAIDLDADGVLVSLQHIESAVEEG